jgi:hypothetical protein
MREVCQEIDGGNPQNAKEEDTKRLLTIAGQLGRSGSIDAAEEAEVGRQLIALYGCGQMAAGEGASLVGRYFRVLELVFDSGQRHTALQRQLNGTSPYTQTGISVLAQSPHCEQVFAFLGYVFLKIKAR